MDSRDRPRMSASDELRYCRNALADALVERDAEQARNATLADTLRSLADEWRAAADEDERWYNGPRVSVSEAHELPALVQQAREHANAVHAILDGPGEEDG